MASSRKGAFSWALLLLARAVAVPAEESCAGGAETCRSDGAAGGLAREKDCDFREPACLALLNASAGLDLVPTQEVMSKVEEVGRDNLHAGGLAGPAWVQRFSKARCASMVQVDFPGTASAAEELRARLSKAGEKPLLVHPEGLDDGIGARFKKAVELVSAALHMGFHAVALAVPPAGSLIHPLWEHGAVHCHESPAQSLKPPEPDEMYPLRCWRFEIQSDLLAQSPEPEGRILLWGAPPAEAILQPAAGLDQKFSCWRFQEELPDAAAWDFHKRSPPQAEVLGRLFASARAFAQPRLTLPGRREALCGHGAAKKHLALHVRRGDVGDDSGYPVTNRMSGKQFGDWICALAGALGLGEGELAVHVHTEAKGQSRKDLRRLGLQGFGFAEEGQDDVEPVFHTHGHFQPAAPCGSVLQEVHVAVNDNPRDALLCMSRADLLVTSQSSLGWASAVLNGGLVLHPDVADARDLVHWDLRDQYMDWAPNWFLTSDVERRPEALAAFWAERKA